MFKKISAALLVTALLVVSVLPMGVFAAAPVTVNVDLPANIMVGGANHPSGDPLSVTTGTTLTYRATADMNPVRDKFTELVAIAAAKGYTDKTKLLVTMEMVLTANLQNGLTINSTFASGNNLDGFSGNLDIYEERSRGADGKTMTIKVGVKNPDDADDKFVTAKQLEDNLNTYLGDLAFDFTGIKASQSGKLKVEGVVAGFTDIYDTTVDDANKIATINYTGVQEDNGADDELAAYVLATTPQSTGGSSNGRRGGSNAGTTQTAPQISTNVNGRVVNVGYGKPVDGQYVVDVNELPAPDQIPGYSWNGQWYTNPQCTEPANGTVPVDENTTFYTRYVNVKAPSVLEADRHLAYIKGYPDGYVRPEKNITREEIAEIIYRLLKTDIRSGIYTTANNFSDVAEDRWSNPSISTMANGGYLQGYPDGTFKPQNSITRAQFATVLVRFLDGDAISAGDYYFNDVSGHWAEADIKKAADYMWILGYADGSFKPDQNITRAEAMTIFNRLLVRYVNASGVRADAIQFADNPADSWYYYQVVEATNSHEYTRQADGYNENWTSMLSETLFD